MINGQLERLISRITKISTSVNGQLRIIKLDIGDGKKKGVG
jgi:hypothetical protein